ncbi:MAG: hypothetical protein JXR37_03730 [Kiritimatiellae bacterium]|nr:hypothetical protein [Kiritimatiellia bacterium]
MTTKTLRLSDELVSAIHDVGGVEHIDDSVAMRKLLAMGYELHLAERYRQGRMTLRNVAARLHTSISEAMDLLQRLGVTGNVSANDTLESLRSLRTCSPSHTRAR